MESTYPAQIKGEQIKKWSKEYFTFVGFFEWDTLLQDSFGWGTYSINGNKYEENIKFHADKSYNGQTIKMLINIQNDTLIQRWPTDENWNLLEKHNIEKYIRRE